MTRYLVKVIVYQLGYIRVLKKLRIWKQAAKSTRQRVEALMRKYHSDPGSVTPEDWDDMAQGSQYKMNFLLHKIYPCKDWPDDVPHSNLIALFAKHKRESDEKLARFDKLLEMAHKTNHENAEYLVKEWEDAMDGTDGSTEHPLWAVMLELARKKEKLACTNKALERNKKELEHREIINEVVRRYNAGEVIYSVEEWEDSLQGTDAMEKNPDFAVLLEHTRHREKIQEMVHRQNAGETYYSVKEWEDIIDGTDTMERYPWFAVLIEQARKKEAGEEEDSADDDSDWETVEGSDDELDGEEAERGLESYSEEKVMAVSKDMEQLELGHEDNSDTKDKKELGDGGSLPEDGA
jgi:hypothetical protein